MLMLLRFPSSCMVVCEGRERERERERERDSVIVCSAAQLPLTNGKTALGSMSQSSTTRFKSHMMHVFIKCITGFLSGKKRYLFR